jgi:molybdopterin-containing oxidoreductase family iron-sulfur binding subunit
MVFGDLNDPWSKVSRLAQSGRATRLLEELGTKPKVIYLQKVK